MAVGDQGSRLVGNTDFYGGLSTDNKIGIENSYADGECLDIRKSPSQMTVLPMARKLADSGVITGLMTAMTQSKDGNIWGVDEGGQLYYIDEYNNVQKRAGGSVSVSMSAQYIRDVTCDRYKTGNAFAGKTSVFTFNGSNSRWECSDPSASVTAITLFNQYGIWYKMYSGKNAAAIYPKNSVDHGITSSYNSSTGVVTLSGTATDTWSDCFVAQTLVLEPGEYTASLSDAAGLGADVCLIITRNGENLRSIVRIPPNGHITFTLKDYCDEVRLFLGTTPNRSYEGKTFKFQLEAGSTATTFERYSGLYPTNGDTITVTAKAGSFSSGYGLEYSAIDNGLWYTDGGHRLYSYGPIVNSAFVAESQQSFDTIQDQSEYIVESIVIQKDGDRNLYQSNPNLRRSNGTNTCAVPTSVSETDANKILFLPASMPIVRIGIRFMAKGAGTVRLEIHDENNNVIGKSFTLNASSVSTSDYTYFYVFPDINFPMSATNQISVTPWSGNTIESGDVLHIHVVASSSGYTVKTTTANNMYLDADIQSFATVLHETFNKKHPMVMKDKLYIGNGRYVSYKESSPLNLINDNLFIQNGLRLDDGFEVCSFASSDEYLIIGAEKYSAGSKRGFQAGRIYFWDTETQNPNFYIDCTMGSPKTMFNFGNIVYIIIAGALYAYTGGKELVKVRTLKGTDTEYSGRNSVTEVYPNMMAVRREILVMGFPSHTTAYTIRHGIYAFGSVDKNFPNSFTYNYKIPAETTSQTLDQYNSDTQELRIGCLYNFNDSLFYSYEVKTTTVTPGQDPVTTTTVGLALVDNDSGTSTTFMWKSLQYDAGAPYLQKELLRIGIYFDPLPANTTITPIYRIDNGPWETGSVTATEGDRMVHIDKVTRFHEIQYGFVGTSGNDLLTPVIKQVSAEIRVLNEEKKL